MAAIPAMVHTSPAATCTATMLRNIGEEDGIGMPRTTTPSSVMRSWPKIAPRQHPLRRAARRGGRRSRHRGMLDAPLFDHLIRPRQQRRWDGEAERLRGLEVDDKLELGRLLDGKIGGLSAVEDLVHIRGDAAKEVDIVRPVRG